MKKELTLFLSKNKSAYSKCCKANLYYCGSVTYCEKCKHFTTPVEIEENEL